MGIDPALLKPDAAIAISREHIKRQGFYEFVRQAWPIVNPGIEFIDGWHIRLICAHLEAVSRGTLDRLVVNVPPGASKSTITSVMWPAWDWTLKPQRKWMAVSCEIRLTGRDALACRRLVMSEWYQQRWGDVARVDESGAAQMTQEIWNLTKGGRRYSTTVGGGAIGWHADIQLIDDPIKPKDMAGDPETARNALERCWAWWTGTMASRRTGAKFARVIIMQRLHELDLVGRILEMDAGAKDEQGKPAPEWTHLMLPMRFEPDRACHTPYGSDPRQAEGELLCEARWNLRTVKELEREFGSQVAAAQLQQRPAPAGGNVFQRTWFQKRWMRKDNPKWKELPALMREHYVPLPERFFTGCISIDCAFKETAGADNVAVQAWGESGANYYLVDNVADRMNIIDTIRIFMGMAARHPWARARLIEDKANGPAVEQAIRNKLSGIIMVNPEGGKFARCNAVSPICQAGNVILPDESEADWVAGFVEELVTVPFSRRDDQSDAMTQALTFMDSRSVGTYLAAMENVANGKVRVAGYEQD